MKGGPFRLPKGGAIDRSQTVGFTFDGRKYQGHPGDTLASALLANGVRVVGRSFKYHRPRGVTSAGVEEAGALVATGEGARREPNTRASTAELFDGLAARSQNAWPSVRFDLLAAINGLFGRFLAAGFYYKTFMGPGRGTGAWMFYEKFIRRAAGMGTASREPDPDAYELAHAHCDLLVVGSGPAGLEAARIAAEAGLKVVLAEQDFELGGGLFRDSGEIDGAAPDAWRMGHIAALESAGSVTCMTRTTVFGLYDGGVAGMVERVTDHLAQPSPHMPRQRFWILRARRIVIASGAIERSVAFGNNDLPGIMTASSARAYANRFGVAVGRRVVVATNNDSGYEAAIDLRRAGVMVSALIDVRERGSNSAVDAARAAKIKVVGSCVPVEAGGREGVEKLLIGRRTGDRILADQWIDCDAVAVSGGWSPVVNLLSHRGSRPVYDAALAAFLPGPVDEPIGVAGAAAGVWRAGDCAQSGRAAGAAAVIALGGSAPDEAAPPPGGWDAAIRPLWEIRAHNRKPRKRFVDPQHDVTTEDIRLAQREGFESVEHLKRYTTLGMATDQGKVGNVVGLALMANATGRSIGESGTTTFRPPYTPVSLGALAGRGSGRHFRPTRRTPMHQWHERRDTPMVDAELWKRAWYYPGDGESLAAAYGREAAAVRETVGLTDVSTLGKIAVQGPDAGKLLDRVYVNGFANLRVGWARYGVMLRDDGFVLDDGTTWRLSRTDWFMTTTTANATRITEWLEELLETRWPDLRVRVTPVTDQWAGAAVAGPKSRDVLATVADDIDLSNDAFPFMGVREGTLGGVPCRMARISFSGETAWEVYVPADFGEAMWDALWQAAEPLGGVLCGLEALGALRIEKGHVTAAELDGRTTLDDVGLGRMASTGKPFIGNVLRQRPELMRDDRPRLVGILPVAEGATVNAGALLRAPEVKSGHGAGWVTSVTYSPALGRWIALGLISGGEEAWRGKPVIAADPVRSGDVEVRIVPPHFFDSTGSRLHA